MALNNYKITSSDVNAVHVEGVQGNALTGSVLENKQVFDKYPDMIVKKFNSLCDYVGTQTPTGDVAINYTSTEINRICTILGCIEAEISMSDGGE